MSITNYFKSAGLPAPNDTVFGPVATHEANRSVKRALEKQQRSEPKKRKVYSNFSEQDRAVIGKYAAENGGAAAQRHFRSKFPDLGESTVRSFKTKYLAALAKQGSVCSIPSKKRGRPLTLGDIDGEVQSYIKALRAAGTPISAPLIIAAAEGIVGTRDRTLLAKNGGSISLHRSWAISIMRRMGYVNRRATTQAKLQVTPDEFRRLQQSYLMQISSFVKVHNIPADLIINWDQTPINVAPTTNWTMAEEGSKRVEVAALNDKRQFTSTLAVTMSGEFLPRQIIYQGKTERCHPTYAFPKGFDIFHTANHWANGETMVRYITNIILPYVARVKEEKNLPADQPALVIFDVFCGHRVEDVETVLEDNKLLSVLVPSNCTDLLQPLDLSTNKAVKDHLRANFQTWYAEQVTSQLQQGKKAEEVKVDMRLSILKEMQAKWIVSAFDYLRSHPEIGINGFKTAGIVKAIEEPESLVLSNDKEEDEDPFADSDSEED